MEEQLWHVQQQSRILQEFRDSIRLLWDDDASQSINRSILNPHQEDDEGMVQGFMHQNHALGESTVRRNLALQLSKEAIELSEQIALLIEQVDEDIEISIQYDQQYRSFYAEAEGMLPEIDQLIATATKIGNGAPPYES